MPYFLIRYSYYPINRINKKNQIITTINLSIMTTSKEVLQSNWGSEAVIKGKQDADSIFELHGLKVIRQIAKYSPNNKDDYCYGKISRSRQIIDEQKQLKIKHNGKD